jgi:uncharacterized protein (TIGR03083 family)
MATDQELVAQLEHVWRSVHGLGIELTEAEWKTPTEVPGWTVQDNLTHLSALESRLLGKPEPDHQIPDGLAHVKNDFGRSNEVFVDSRRAWSGADALGEFDEVTRERVAQLHRSSTGDFGAESWTPVGPGTVRDLLPFRVFDAWVHEQDMRRAVNRPGDLDGPVADSARARILASLPFVIGKKVAPPEGSTVVFELSAPLASRAAIRMEGRARRLDEVPATATVTIRTDGERLTRLACGRGDPAAVVASGAVTFEGDAALGRRVVESLNFLM